MLPEGWKCLPLHQVAEIRTGLAKSSRKLSDPVTLPYLRVANVQDGYFDLEDVRSIPVERDDVARYSLRTGDVLMTEGGDFDKLGRGAVWQGAIEPCLHQNHVFVVRPDVKVLDPHYLSALSASAYGRSYFLGCAKRSTNLASINSSQLKAFPVLLPPIAEQRAVAGLLSVWDGAIALHERELARLRSERSALLQDLTSGRRRLRASAAKETEEAESQT